MNAIPSASPLERFRTIVMADEALQMELVPLFDPDVFIATLVARAGERGITLDPAALMPIFRPDPLGLNRFDEVPLDSEAYPPRHWLPSQLVWSGSVPAIDWLHHGGQRLIHPFYADSVHRVRSLPFNRLFRVRTRLDALAPAVLNAPAPAPDGFIFHMSRCGSTLVSQMLAAVPENIMVSEAGVLDEVLQLTVAGHIGVEAFQAIVHALLRDRSGTTRRRFIKLDSWHTLALPLFRHAFPDVPWIFLYRDPVEVLVSQKRSPGIQIVRGALPAITGGDDLHPDEYAAWLLDRICRGALESSDDSNALLVNYRALPGAVQSEILPHFGIDADAAELALMVAAGGRNSKAPDQVFVADAAAKQAEAKEDMRAVAGRFMAESYAALEAARMRQPAQRGGEAPM